METCEEMGFPIAAEKTEGPVTIITLLGIVLDSAKVNPEKFARWRTRKSCTKRELQSLAGHLNYACKVIRPACRFLWRVFGLLSQFHKRDHMIRLNAAFRVDLEW